MQVAVQLLGSFAVEIDGRKVPPDAWGRRHAAWLVKLLALAPGRQLHRDQVLDQLWPEAPPDDAAGRLHKAAHYARRAADCAEIVVLRRELVALAPGADVSVDADAFEEASTEALRTGDPERLEAALALYTGELLPEDRYAEWSLPHRNRLALRHRELLRAVGRWPTLIELDPTDEEAYIGLMREDLERGDRTAVRRTFDQLAEVLSRELGIGPSPEAVELRDRALAGQDDLAPITAPRHAGLATQSIRFLRSFDDVRIAYAVSGSGPPLVKTPNWLTHLDYDWESPVWRGWWQALSQRYQLIRFDERGCGMSDWDVEDLSLEASVRDLEVLVDSIGLERFPLLGISHGGAIAIRYADRHPERVSRLILYGAYALGRDLMATTEAERKANDALRTAMHIGWGTDDPAFRLIYAHKFMPEGPLEQWQAFAELQRHTASAEGAVRLWTEYGSVDVRDGARRIRVPTLILHARDEILRRFDDARLLAELIPDSELVPLPSCNHILQRGEPAFEQFLAEVDRFLAAA